MFFNRLALVFASGATNETSSPPVSRVYCKAKHSALKRAKEERMKDSVVKYRSTIGHFFGSYDIYAFFVDSSCSIPGSLYTPRVAPWQSMIELGPLNKTRQTRHSLGLV